MKLLSVNVGTPREVQYQGRTVLTGIFKQQVGGRVMLRTTNLDGDRQADLQAHGGRDKAVYVYSLENYEHWKRQLGRDDFQMGQFGENLTVEGMMDKEVYVGDVFRVGEAVVEVTQPRAPCFKLGIRMQSPLFPKMFLKSCRVGFYVRVLEEGRLAAGDTIQLVRSSSPRMSVRRMCHLLYFDPDNLTETHLALRIPALSAAWRVSFEQRLASASPSPPGRG